MHRHERIDYRQSRAHERQREAESRQLHERQNAGKPLPLPPHMDPYTDLEPRGYPVPRLRQIAAENRYGENPHEYWSDSH